MKKSLIKAQARRTLRVRSKLKGTAERPRLTVYRSNKHMFVQLIDDATGKTMVAVSDEIGKSTGDKKRTKTERAHDAGKKAAELAVKKNIKTALFDRGHNRYHGRVKSVAEGAREGGLQF